MICNKKHKQVSKKWTVLKCSRGQRSYRPPLDTVITNLRDNYVIELASVAWQFNETTPKLSGRNFANGALLQYGKGRVVIFGEAAMFTAQLAGPTKVPWA